MGRKKKGITQVGVTPEDKKAIDGVFRMFDTIGLPLDIILDQLHERDLVVSWKHFFRDALKAGWTLKTTMNRVTIAVRDAYLPDYADEVVKRLELLKERIESDGGMEWLNK